MEGKRRLNHIRILAESEKYLIQSEFEPVYLIFKQSKKNVGIGDFYGDPDMAAISEDEKTCVMCGCGVIIYFLKEPFKQYSYVSYDNNQWIEFGREQGKEIWVEIARFIDNSTIELITEYQEKIILSIQGNRVVVI